jgi:hypothetical protein
MPGGANMFSALEDSTSSDSGFDSASDSGWSLPSDGSVTPPATSAPPSAADDDGGDTAPPAPPLPPGAELVHTGSAKLARQRSAMERARRLAAQVELADLESEELAASQQLAAVQLDVELLHGLSLSPGGTLRGPGRTNSEASPVAATKTVMRRPIRSVSGTALLYWPARNSRAGLPIEQRAVTVEWLVTFADRHDAWHMKTWEVVQHVIKPLTAQRRCRFCELESEVPDGVLGHVDSFLSHCWGTEFGDLVSAARHNARFGRRYWVDIFAVNQHGSGDDKKAIKTKRSSSRGKLLANQPVERNENGDLVPQFEADLRGLNHVVRAATQGTTLVLCPRKAMGASALNPMRRIWCVEEIRETLEAKQPLVIKCGAATGREQTFREEWDHQVTEELVLSVNVAEAEATVQSDREMILEKLRVLPGGFDAVNMQVQNAIWVGFSARGLPAWQLAVQGQAALNDALQEGSLVAADVNARNPEGWTALHVSANAGNPMHVRALLAVGAEVDTGTAKGRTPAFNAAWEGHLAVLVELHAAGANLNSYDLYGESIAHRARVGPTKNKNQQKGRKQGKMQQQLVTPRGGSGGARREIASCMGVTEAHRAVSTWLEEHGAISFNLKCGQGCRHCDPPIHWPKELPRPGPRTPGGRGGGSGGGGRSGPSTPGRRGGAGPRASGGRGNGHSAPTPGGRGQRGGRGGGRGRGRGQRGGQRGPGAGGGAGGDNGSGASGPGGRGRGHERRVAGAGARAQDAGNR